MQDEFEKWIQLYQDEAESREGENDKTIAAVTMAIKLKYRAFKAKAVEVEPLAVLAKRKGFNEVMWSEYPREFGISIRNFDRGVDDLNVFGGADYPTAEAKARAYLNSLPDKEDKP